MISGEICILQKSAENCRISYISAEFGKFFQISDFHKLCRNYDTINYEIYIQYYNNAPSSNALNESID